MTEADYNKSNMRLAFVGKGDAAPATMPSTAMVQKLVQVNPMAIGIIPVADVTDAVNNVTVE